MDRNKIFTPNYIQVDGKAAKIIGDGDTILVLDSAGQIYHKNGESIAPLVAGGGGTVDLSWNNIKSKPQWIIDENAPNASKLGNVAASEYARKSDIPSIPATVTWSTLSGKPTWIGNNKPSYTWSEVGNKPTWIGANKPSYTWSEIGNKPSWIGSAKPSYTWDELGNKPTSLSLDNLTTKTLTASTSINCSGDIVAFATNTKMTKQTLNDDIYTILLQKIDILEKKVEYLENKLSNV